MTAPPQSAAGGREERASAMLASAPIGTSFAPGDLPLDAQQCAHSLEAMSASDDTDDDGPGRATVPVVYIRDVRGRPPTRALPALPSASRPPSIDASTHAFCQICLQDVALGTGFCWRCEQLWASAVAGTSTFVPTRALPAVPRRAPDSVLAAGERSSGGASAGWASCASSSASSSFAEGFVTAAMSPGSEASRPRTKARAPRATGRALDAFTRRGSVPRRLKLRALLAEPAAGRRRRARAPTPLSQAYDGMPYYFDDAGFRRQTDVRDIRPAPLPPCAAARCARRVARGDDGWL